MWWVSSPACRAQDFFYQLPWASQNLVFVRGNFAMPLRRARPKIWLSRAAMMIGRGNCKSEHQTALDRPHNMQRIGGGPRPDGCKAEGAGPGPPLLNVLRPFTPTENLLQRRRHCKGRGAHVMVDRDHVRLSFSRLISCCATSCSSFCPDWCACRSRWSPSA